MVDQWTDDMFMHAGRPGAGGCGMKAVFNCARPGQTGRCEAHDRHGRFSPRVAALQPPVVE